VILATTRRKLREAIRLVNQTLAELKLRQHPDKTFIVRISRCPRESPVSQPAGPGPGPAEPDSLPPRPLGGGSFDSCRGGRETRPGRPARPCPGDGQGQA
jgi:hypothetical protein